MLCWNIDNFSESMNSGLSKYVRRFGDRVMV